MVLLLRCLACLFALLAIGAANGWGLTASLSHALAWLAAAVLVYVLSTITPPQVP